MCLIKYCRKTSQRTRARRSWSVDMRCCRLSAAPLLGTGKILLGGPSFDVSLHDKASSSSAPVDIAVVPHTEIVLPVLLIRMLRMGDLLTSCLSRNPKILLRLSFTLPSLLPELTSGTLVSALRMVNLPYCCRTGVGSAATAVISPTGGKCEPYSSARLMRFLAHISAMPSIADCSSALSAARRMSANANAAIGGSTWLRPLGDPDGVGLGDV